MPRARPQEKRRFRRRTLLALLVAVSATPSLGGTAAHAQDSGLRGDLSQEEVNDYLLGKNAPFDPAATGGSEGQAEAQAHDQQPPTYSPTSTGAVAEENDDATPGDSIFDEPDSPDDPFADDGPASSSRLPTTANLRKQAAQAETGTGTGSDNEAAEPTAQASTTAEEDESRFGILRQATIDAEGDLPIDPGAERITAIEGLANALEDNPYDAVGIRVGTFILRPTLEQGVTASSNVDFSSDSGPGVFSETTLRLNAVSDWTENSAVINGYGNYRKSISGEELDEIRAGIDGELQYDLGNEYRALATAGYVITPESASSPDAIVGAVSQPLRQTFEASLGLEKDVGKARFGVTGGVERDIYGDADLSDGTVVSQKDRDSTLVSLTLRGGYEISPAITPFIATEVGRRIYDLKEDAGGYQRSSTRIAARGGVELDLTEKVTGEFAIGAIRETFDDDRLAPITGPTIDGLIAWSPERGTVVNLLGTTSIEDSTTAGDSGSILYTNVLSIERQIRSNLTGNLALGAAYRDYTDSSDHDLTLSAEAGATYWINRYAGLTGRLRHEELSSNIPDRAYDSNSVFLGLKLQR